MNVIEKILARASGRDSVAPGDVVVAKLHHMVLHDLSANFVARVFQEELPGEALADPSRIIIVFDHNFSPATEQAAQALVKQGYLLAEDVASTVDRARRHWDYAMATKGSSQ